MEQKKGKSRPFILYPRQNIEEIRQCVLENYGLIKYELPFLNALCVEIPEEKEQTIKTNKRVAMMSEDIGVSKLSTGQTTQALSSFRRRRNYYSGEGKGVTIAIIDTGVSPHYDLIKPFNRILYFKDFVNRKTLPYDDDGHGTHVAGIALGNGYSSGKHKGTAPGAALVSLKALDEEGNGNASDILAAMQWIYDNHRRYNIRVVNLSLGVIPSNHSQIDPLVLGANALVCAGICVVAAAGNSGPDRETITSPGISPLVMTVGSYDDDNKNSVPDFSSRGPTISGLPKPDVLAPGVDIISLSSQNPKGYIGQTGTSMSAPFVSGLAADYCSIHPDAHPLEVKKALLRCAHPIKKADRYTQGYGLLSRGLVF